MNLPIETVINKVLLSIEHFGNQSGKLHMKDVAHVVRYEFHGSDDEIGLVFDAILAHPSVIIDDGDFVLWLKDVRVDTRRELYRQYMAIQADFDQRGAELRDDKIRINQCAIRYNRAAVAFGLPPLPVDENNGV